VLRFCREIVENSGFITSWTFLTAQLLSAAQGDAVPWSLLFRWSYN